MTKFENEALLKLLNMKEQELYNDGAFVAGKPINTDKVRDLRNKINDIVTFLVCID